MVNWEGPLKGNAAGAAVAALARQRNAAGGVKLDSRVLETATVLDCHLAVQTVETLGPVQTLCLSPPL